MVEAFKRSRVAALVAGFVVGIVAAGLLPHRPLEAVATDRQENFAIATGWVDAEMEAVFFLDFLTGDLRAAVLSPINGKFNALYQTNILTALNVDVAKNPKYLMVTGQAQLRRGGGQIQPGASVVYVAELTGGKVAAYAVPWSKAASNSGQPVKGALVPLDSIQFRTAVVRTE
ncbi:MAG: hypothetical protein WD847_04940 [Pirellulales bacterium]